MSGGDVKFDHVKRESYKNEGKLVPTHLETDLKYIMMKLSKKYEVIYKNIYPKKKRKKSRFPPSLRAD